MTEVQKKIADLFSEILKIVYGEDRKDDLSIGPSIKRAVDIAAGRIASAGPVELECPHVRDMDVFWSLHEDHWGAMRDARTPEQRDAVLASALSPETWERYQTRYENRLREGRHG